MNEASDELNAAKLRIKQLEDAIRRIKQELESAAANRKFMQIAQPARTCLNIIKLVKL